MKKSQHSTWSRRPRVDAAFSRRRSNRLRSFRPIDRRRNSTILAFPPTAVVLSAIPCRPLQKHPSQVSRCPRWSNCSASTPIRPSCEICFVLSQRLTFHDFRECSDFWQCRLPSAYVSQDFDVVIVPGLWYMCRQISVWLDTKVLSPKWWLL